MNVLGLDLSLTATGVCLPDGTTFTIKTKASDGDKRLIIIEDTITRIAPGAALAVIEDLPTHAKSAGITGMVHGVVRAALMRASVPVAFVVPATLKAYAAGAGNADKAAMAVAAFKRAGIEFEDDNQCDAWWLRAAGLERLGRPIVELPQVQRARLDKAKWPAWAVAA